MPERFIVPSLKEVAKTVDHSIKETEQWIVSSATSRRKNSTVESKKLVAA